MIKKLMIMLAMLFSVTLVAACGGNSDEQQTISFKDGNSITISVMQTYTMEITSIEEGVTPTWSVKEGQSEIIKISSASDGMKATVSGLKKGVAEVEVKTEKTSATVQVIVENSTELALLDVQQEDVPLLTGGTYSIKPTLTFKEESLSATYKYFSQNTEVVEVDANGVVTAAGLGQTKITVTASYLNFSFEKEILFTVQPVIEVVSNLKELTIYNVTEEGHPYKTSEAISVEVAYDGTKLSSDELQIDTLDHDIAIIEDGEVIGLKKGQTKVEIKFTILEKEYKDYIFVTVKDLPQVEIQLKENVTMYEYYREHELSEKVLVDGEEVDGAIVSYTSQNEAVAKVEDGKIKAVSNGSTKIDAVYDDGYRTYSNEINVEIKNSISLASETLGEGKNGIIAEIRENSALCFESEIDLSAATKSDSLIKFHILSQNGKDSKTADVEYLYVKLTDTENPENYVTYKINKQFTNPSKSYIKVSSAGNGFYGLRSNGKDIGVDRPSGLHGEMGSSLSYSLFADENSLDSVINLSYDYETNCAYAIEGDKVDNPTFIFDLDTAINTSTLYKNYIFFEGFTSGKVNLSIYAEGYAENVDMVKIYVEGINNTDTLTVDQFLMR